MKEHPILFSGPMVRAILAGIKCQTRRVVKIPPFDPTDDMGAFLATNLDRWAYHVGDLLWVRETWATIARDDKWPPSQLGPGGVKIIYAATEPQDSLDYCERGKWRPSIFMPRWASRITLEVTEVRVQRVQAISHDDAIAEGIDLCNSSVGWIVRDRFQKLWDSINGKRGYGWDKNPRVWAVTFRRLP